MSEIADVQALGGFQAREGIECLAEVEGEVPSTLEQERRRLHPSEQPSCRALRRKRAHGTEVASLEHIANDRLDLRSGPRSDRLPEAEDDARPREALRRQGRVEVAPGGCDLDRGEGHAVGRRPPDGTATVGVPKGADSVWVHARLRAQPVDELAYVLDLPRPVDRDESARVAVSPRVEREH